MYTLIEILINEGKRIVDHNPQVIHKAEDIIKFLVEH